MTQITWRGVMPAITTPWTLDGNVDLAFVRRHVAWLVDHGCTGIITPGSLGEGAALEREEKIALWGACVEGVKGRVPVVAAVAAASTRGAVRTAEDARDAGCTGLMVLPPYVYKGSSAETIGHMGAIARATDLSCMLYNNPVAYGVDLLPEDVVELAAAHANIGAVKESSGDARRVTALVAALPQRVAVLVGLDDMLVEGVRAGALGWVAGLANALPTESVRLFELALRGERQACDALYAWFLPLLRMDTTYDFVQRIKQVQAAVDMVGVGGDSVRPPRTQPTGQVLEAQRAQIAAILRERAAT
jgi:dihydrodipicolinate synthase/N-acetylneuraminate lyase